MAGRKSKYQAIDGAYFIVNPGGVVHECDRAHARWRLAFAGWRLASDDEIECYQSRRVQPAGDPCGEPFEPLPELEPELPE